VNTFFGLAFLNPEDVGDSFAVDLIPDMPSDNKVQDFADYVLSTYVDDNTMHFEYANWRKLIPAVFSGVRVTRSLVLYVCFVDRCLSFCLFSDMLMMSAGFL
jgi:hypothetical protein